MVTEPKFTLKSPLIPLCKGGNLLRSDEPLFGKEGQGEIFQAEMDADVIQRINGTPH
jgi:hypothetical protein